MDDWLNDYKGLPLRQALKQLVRDTKADNGAMSSMAEHTWDQIWADRLKYLLTITE